MKKVTLRIPVFKTALWTIMFTLMSFLLVGTSCFSQTWTPNEDKALYKEAMEQVKFIEPFSKFLANEKATIQNPSLAYLEARWAFIKDVYHDNPKVATPNKALQKFINFCTENNLLGEQKAQFKKAAKILGYELITDKVAFEVPTGTYKEFLNIPYVYHNDYPQKLDLFVPNFAVTKPVPCIIFIHGGGWQVHKRAWFESFARYAAFKGYAAVTIDYRMLHAVDSPLECVYDAKAAVRWVRANAAKYHIDPNKIGVSGASAGGHLAAILATSGDVPDVEGRVGNLHVSSEVQAAVGLATPALTGKRFSWPWNRGEKPKWFNKISPYRYIDKGDAPMKFIHGTADKTVDPDDAKDLYEAYKKNGLTTEIEFIEGAGHVFYMNEETAAKVLGFFKQILENPNNAKKNVGKTLEASKYQQLRKGLKNSFLKFQEGGKARVGFLGGSITYNWGWRNMIMDYLSNRFPQTEFEFISAGIPSTGSTAGAFRLYNDILAKGRLDLLFEEAAVNDRAIGKSNVQISRAMEGIVRQALKSNPSMDVVLMYFVDPQKMETYNGGNVPEVIQIHDRIAEHYGIPSINLALEVTERINAKEFTWEDDFKDLHPSPFGQKLYFNAIKTLFEAAWNDDAIGGNMEPLKKSVPLAIDKAAYGNGKLMDIDQAKYKTGWTIDSNWKPMDKSDRTRQGFVNVPLLVSDTPGAKLEFSFKGTAVGINNVSGKDAGVIRYRIDGKNWEQQDLFTRHSDYVHLPRYFVLASGLEKGNHKLEIELLNTKNDKSIGTACRIKNFMIN